MFILYNCSGFWGGNTFQKKVLPFQRLCCMCVLAQYLSYGSRYASVPFLLLVISLDGMLDYFWCQPRRAERKRADDMACSPCY